MLFSRRFFPLFITQFFGAFNDNLLKSGVVMLMTYRLAENPAQAQHWVTLAGGIFILPFFLFSATAGLLADKYDRAHIARLVKLAEIGLMAIAIVGFTLGHVWLLLASLFLMGMHSAFFGPVKYSLLPQHLPGHELLRGNAYVEAGTFLAILLGTILGGLLILWPSGAYVLSAGLCAVAILGYVASRFIPPAPPPEPHILLQLNPWKTTQEVLRHSWRDRPIFQSILGISWFWFLGAAMLAQFPVFTKNVLGGDETVVTLLLTLFSSGIGIGSLIAVKLPRANTRPASIPLAAAGMSLFLLDLFLHARNLSPELALVSAAEFVHQPGSLRLLADLSLLSICGGIYIVPLYTSLQRNGQPEHRARIIAANNVVNAFFMVMAALLLSLLAKIGLSIAQVFLVLSALNAMAVPLLLRRSTHQQA